MKRIINVTIALAVIIGLSLIIADTISAQNKRTDAPNGSGNGDDAGSKGTIIP